MKGPGRINLRVPPRPGEQRKKKEPGRFRRALSKLWEPKKKGERLPRDSRVRELKPLEFYDWTIFAIKGGNKKDAWRAVLELDKLPRGKRKKLYKSHRLSRSEIKKLEGLVAKAQKLDDAAKESIRMAKKIEEYKGREHGQ